MAIPKRIKGYRDRAEDTREELQKDYEESYNSKDDRGFIIGTVLDLDAIKELGIEIWRPAIGDHFVDVIPFYAGTQHPSKAQGVLTYKVDYFAHQRVGAMNDFFVCPTMTWRKPCPICTWLKPNYVPDKREYNSIKAQRRCIYFVWVHDNDEQRAKGLQLFDCSHFFFEKKVAEIARKPRAGGWVDWTNYDNGKHVFWTIAKSGKYEDVTGTKRDSIEYSSFQFLDREESAIPNSILEQSFALDEIIKMHPTEEEISTAFFGSNLVKRLEEENAKLGITGGSDRLPKKTALERAREKAEAQSNDDDDEPVNDETTNAVEYDIPDDEPDDIPEEVEQEVKQEKEVEEKKEEKPKKILKAPPKATKKPDTTYVCPAAELGGVFGVTIEEMDECDDCEIWEKCSDENDQIRKGLKEPPDDSPSNKGGGSKLVRR